MCQTSTHDWIVHQTCLAVWLELNGHMHIHAGSFIVCSCLHKGLDMSVKETLTLHSHNNAPTCTYTLLTTAVIFKQASTITSDAQWYCTLEAFRIEAASTPQSFLSGYGCSRSWMVEQVTGHIGVRNTVCSGLNSTLGTLRHKLLLHCQSEALCNERVSHVTSLMHLHSHHCVYWHHS